MHSLWHSLGVGLVMADLALSLSGLRLTHRRGRLLNSPNIPRRNKNILRWNSGSLHPEFTRTQPTACQSEPAKKNVSGLNVGRTNLVEAN